MARKKTIGAGGTAVKDRPTKKRSKKSKSAGSGSTDTGLMEATTGDLIGNRNGIAGVVIEDRVPDIVVSTGGKSTIIVPRTSPHHTLHQRCESPLRGVGVGSRIRDYSAGDTAIVTEIGSATITAEMQGMDEGAELVLGWDEEGWQLDLDADSAPEAENGEETGAKYSQNYYQPQLREIPIDQIAIVVEARGVDQAHVDRLAAAYEAGDMLPPIEVYEVDGASLAQVYQVSDKPGAYILGPGRHRLEAHKQIGRETVAAFVHPPASIDVIERAQLLENLNRNDMLPIEEAENVARLMERCRDAAYLANHPDAQHDPVSHVAAKIGRTKAWVQDRMYVDRLCKPARTLARRAQIPAGHLRELAKVGDHQTQLNLASQTIGMGWRLIDGDMKTGELIDRCHADVLEEIDQRSRERSFNMMTISELRAEVDMAQRPLRSVPWDLRLPVVEPGKNGRTLPACAGCPHNSETDAMLFAVEGEQRHGVCHNASCYQAKKDAAEKAKQALAKMATRKREPTPEQIREKAPDWMKGQTAVGLVKREWKKRQDGGPAGKPGRATYPHSNRKLTRKLTKHELALKKFDAAMDKWRDDVGVKIFNQLRRGRDQWATFVCVAVSSRSKELHGAWKIPQPVTYAKEERRAPTEPRPLSKSAKQLLGIIMTSGIDHARELPVKRPPMNKYQQPRIELHVGTVWHPDAMDRLASDMEIAHDPPPHWRDFAPGSEKQPKPKQSKKRTTRKKSKRKKTSRKKNPAKGGAA